MQTGQVRLPAISNPCYCVRTNLEAHGLPTDGRLSFCPRNKGKGALSSLTTHLPPEPRLVLYFSDFTELSIGILLLPNILKLPKIVAGEKH